MLVCRGGLGGEPGNEAHGGYTYCGVAALALLGKVHTLDVARLKAWLAQRQAAIEGGFNGRTNKLTDGCYSFWQGGAGAVLARAHTDELSMWDYAGSSCRHHVEAAECIANAGATCHENPGDGERVFRGHADVRHSSHHSSCDTGT